MRVAEIRNEGTMGWVAVLCVIVTACGNVTAQSPAKESSEISASDNGTSLCDIQHTSTLPGVTIEITGSRCSWSLAEARAGIRIPYELRIDQDIAGVIPRSRSSSVPGPSGLILFEELRGGGQVYCQCSVGQPGVPIDEPSTAKEGTYVRVFEWGGRNWRGNDDVIRPKGEYFPPGTYTLTISVQGWWLRPSGRDVFEVTGTIDINLHD